jgi:threonine/homoserine/homoserine lactone efflux protein
MNPTQLIAFATFVAVGTGSPGPNNTLLLASGMAFGVRRTIPHVLGTTLGMALLVALAVAGAGAVMAAVPGLRVILRVVASAYLLYLAARLARGVALDPTAVQAPFSVPRATAFQFINPKAWVFALALATGFAPDSRAGDVLVLVVLALIVTITAACWAAGGATLRRVLEGRLARRVTGVVLGLMLVSSVVLLWVSPA